MSIIDAPKNKKQQRTKKLRTLKQCLEELPWKSYRLKEVSCIGFMVNASPHCFEDANFNEAAWIPPNEKNTGTIILELDCNGSIKKGRFEYSLSSCLLNPRLRFIKRVPLKTT
jgi:hypothetical protein